jgi:hypothetical protein
MDRTGLRLEIRMSNLLQFIGGRRRVAQVVGQSAPIVHLPESVFGARLYAVSTGASYQTIVSFTGRGALNFAALQCRVGGGSSGLRITIDGRQISAITGSLAPQYGFCGVGAVASSGSVGGMIPQTILFSSALLIEAFASEDVAGSGNMSFVLANFEVDV